MEYPRVVSREMYEDLEAEVERLRAALEDIASAPVTKYAGPFIATARLALEGNAG